MDFKKEAQLIAEMFEKKAKEEKKGFELINSKHLANLRKEFTKLHDAACEIQEILGSLEEKKVPEDEKKCFVRGASWGLPKDRNL